MLQRAVPGFDGILTKIYVDLVGDGVRHARTSLGVKDLPYPWEGSRARPILLDRRPGGNGSLRTARREPVKIRRSLLRLDETVDTARVMGRVHSSSRGRVARVGVVVGVDPPLRYGRATGHAIRI